MLELACSKLAETIVDVKSFLSNKKQKQNTWSPVQICCIVEMIEPPSGPPTRDTRIQKKTNLPAPPGRPRTMFSSLFGVD